MRLDGFDYAEERAYFVTICVHDRSSLFGEVVGDTMQLSAFGEIARGCWLAIPDHFPSIELDAFVVMPNHMHGIITIQSAENVEARHALPLQNELQPDSSGTARHALPLQTESRPVAGFGKPQPRSLGTIVGSYKSAVTKQANDLRGTPGAPVWQRNYYDHIIRAEDDLNAIRAYIEANPVRWADDREPENPVWNRNL